ncbi:MAG: ATP-binding protein, partial [Acidobacteriota bacterium]
KERNAVLLSEDDWLAQLYPGEVESFDDYVRLSRRMRPLVKDLVQKMLRAGANVVMDFAANTTKQRAWFKELCAEVRALHEMVYLAASNEVCLKHIAKRRLEQPERAVFDTEQVFLKVVQYFEEPEDAEGLNVRRVEVSG